MVVLRCDLVVVAVVAVAVEWALLLLLSVTLGERNEAVAGAGARVKALHMTERNNELCCLLLRCLAVSIDRKFVFKIAGNTDVFHQIVVAILQRSSRAYDGRRADCTE